MSKTPRYPPDSLRCEPATYSAVSLPARLSQPGRTGGRSRTAGSWAIDKGFDRICNVCCLTPLMKPRLVVMMSMICLTGALFGQADAPGLTPTPTPKRSWFGRVFHPPPKLPQYKDPRIRGLDLQLAVSPQPLKLSETRQM